MQPIQNRKLSGGWKTLIASLSVTSLIGLVNLFSNEDAKTTNSHVIDTLFNNPIPTLVPAVEVSIPVSAPAPTAVPAAVPTALPIAPVPPTVYIEAPQAAPIVPAAQPAPALKTTSTTKKPSAPKPSTSTSSS